MLTGEGLYVDDIKLQELLGKYFLSHFNTPEYFAFTFSNGDAGMNTVWRFVTEVFEDPAQAHAQSCNLARFLHECSAHPNIKSGDLYMAYFDKVTISGETTAAIGIYKTENKESFLRLVSNGSDYAMITEQGINTDKLDKGCLILDNNRSGGYKVLIIDKGRDSQYWRDDFLKLKPLADTYYFTQNYLAVTKNFVTQQLNQDFEVSRAEQIDLLNKSVEYFKTTDTFNEKEFTETVFGDEQVINSFRQFREESLEDQDVELADDFAISTAAVKKQARIFKSVLKLDKNFHIYIHGDKDLIEKGVDEQGRKYYKIFYTEET